MNDDLCSGELFGIPFARGDRHSADASNAGQGFAAEAHGHDRTKIISCFDLAGRVAFETEQCVIPTHPAAIVSHANETAAARLDFDRYPGGTGIERVFHQFFDDACWTFHDFTGRDLVGYIF